MGSKKVNNLADRHKGAKSGQRNTVRIIGGQWRGSKLRFIDAKGLRPSGDRSRETLFNWLSANIAGARCLDLFAGSGCLSFEALSRGAASAIALDNHRQVIDCIRQEAQRLQADTLTALCVDAMRWLQEASANSQCYDVIFIDPPFASNKLEHTLGLLQQSKLLADNALIYVEQPAKQDWINISSWELIKQKQVSAVRMALYKSNG